MKRGLVSLTLIGSRPERVLNVYARRRLRVWEPCRLDALRLRVLVRRRDLARAVRLAEGAYCAAEPGPEALRPGPAEKLKKRLLLLPPAVLCVFAALSLSLFIWELRVEGNERLTDAQILQTLDAEGIRVGCFGLCIDRELLRSRVMEALPDVEWMTVNVTGCRAVVIVRERRLPPPMVDRETPTDLVAARTGLITELRVFSGVPVTETGATVLQGETLVMGRRGSLSGRERLLPSLAVVKARTWYELSASLPLSCTGKRYTGRVEKRFALLPGNSRINFYGNGSAPLDACDKIVYKERLSLPGGMLLPLALETAEYREYEPVPLTLSAETAEALLRDRLLRRLREQLSGEPLSLDFAARIEDGRCIVTLRAECLEEIGRSVPIGDGVNNE